MTQAQDSDAPASGSRERAEAIPNASSPQLLTHLLEMIGRGIRTGRGLREALGVDARTVQYYLQAAVWLGFVRDEPDPVLTPEGLAYVYGGGRRRLLYAAAIESQPFLNTLRSRFAGDIPAGPELAEAIALADPTLSAATVQRRASSIRGLVAPWRDERAARRLEPDPGQLPLPLPPASAPAAAPTLTRLAGAAFSPDIYRWILCHLLDHGELTFGHVRALLDAAGATEAPLNGYIELAIERGDALPIDERLVATPQATQRRDLAESTQAVIVSDAGWRAHIDQVRGLGPAGVRATPASAPGRYRPWDLRLLGHVAAPQTIERDLQAALRDRSLAAWPVTSAVPPMPPTIVPRPFLEVWTRSGLLVSLPPSLVHVWEGVAGINRRLRNARHRTDAVATPTVAYRPVAAHGGLLHPGEALPRSIPDTRTLRHRLLMHAPYPAMVTALLLSQRMGATMDIVRLREGWWVRHQRRRIGPLLEVCDAFAASCGWHPCRRRGGGINASELLGLLSRVGLTCTVDDRALLDDVWFHQSRVDEEEEAMARALEPLREAMAGWLDQPSHAEVNG